MSKGKLEREANDDGLRIITGADYEKRTELESLKYFTSINANVNMKLSESVVYTKNDSIDNTRLAFLTPANVSLGTDGNISLLDNPFDAKTNLKIQTTISNINLAKKSPFQAFKPLTVENPQKPLKFDPQDLNIKNELTNIMANFNCTLITSISNPFHGMLQLLIMDYDPYTDVGDLLGDEWMGIDELDVPAIQKASEDHEVTTNKNPIPIFANLAFPLFTSGAGMTNIFSKFSILKAPTGTTKSWLKSTYNMDYYTLNSSNNAVTNYNKFSAAEVPALATPPTPSSNSISPQLMTAMAGLPNQIKSLFLSGMSKNIVRYDWSGKRAALIQSPTGKASFMLNYKAIRKTEVMVGYEIDDNGSPLLKRPVWKPLTYKILKTTGASNLLCRSVKYENPAFGVKEPLSMRLPVYNKYFIINKPGSAKATGLLRRGQRLWSDRLSKRINRILRQHQFISGEYLSTAVVSSKRIIPQPATKQKLISKLNLSKNIKPSKV